VIAAALAAAAPAVAAAEPTPETRLSRLEAGIEAATSARRWDEAIALGREALAIEEGSKGSDDPEVGGTLSLIAGWLAAEGKPAEATPLYRRALAIFTARLGPGSRLSEEAASNLAANLQVLGQFEEAQRLYRAALDRALAAGAESRPAALAYNNLAYALGKQGRFTDARDLYAKAHGSPRTWTLP